MLAPFILGPHWVFLGLNGPYFALLGLKVSYLALVMPYLAMKDALPMPELRSSVGRSSAV